MKPLRSKMLKIQSRVWSLLFYDQECEVTDATAAGPSEGGTGSQTANAYLSCCVWSEF